MAEGTVTPIERRVDVTNTNRRPYLINTTGDVVTCHNNAWMDAIGIIMLVELVIGPAMQGTKGIMIWDNCSPHKVPAVRAACEVFNLRIEELPPRMTDQLQVMDLARGK